MRPMGTTGATGPMGTAGLSVQIIGGGAKKMKDDKTTFIGMFTYGDKNEVQQGMLQVMSIAGAVTDFYVLTGDNTKESYTLTLFRNGVITADSFNPITCTVTDAGATNDKCNDTTHCVDYTALETISIQSVPSGTKPTNDLEMSWTAIFHLGTTCAALGF